MRAANARLLINAGEGQRVEFKQSTAETRQIIESLGAFAHSKGGTVFVGVTDAGKVVGVQLGANTIEHLVSEIRHHTQPRLEPTVEAITLAEGTVIALVIKRVGALVHAFDQAWVRVGKTNQKMGPDQVTKRVFRGFRAENSARQAAKGRRNDSWKEREQRRVRLYQRSRGLFLVHEWRPSSIAGQVADIVIYLRQHGDGPLTGGTVKSVEYHLGPKFFGPHSCED